MSEQREWIAQASPKSQIPHRHQADRRLRLLHEAIETTPTVGLPPGDGPRREGFKAVAIGSLLNDVLQPNLISPEADRPPALVLLELPRLPDERLSEPRLIPSRRFSQEEDPGVPRSNPPHQPSIGPRKRRPHRPPRLTVVVDETSFRARELAVSPPPPLIYVFIDESV